MNDIVKPNFLIAGAPRSGSTSVFRLLQQHKSVFMPENKEPHYFVQPNHFVGNGPRRLGFDSISDQSKYYDLFSSSAGYSLRGECSIGYLYFHELAVPVIQRELVAPKIVFILRDPIERLISSYWHHVKHRQEKLSLEAALRAERVRRDEGWWFGFQLRGLSAYYAGVSHFMKEFDSVHVIIAEDFFNDPTLVMNRLHDFLDLPEVFEDQGRVRFNASRVPKSFMLASVSKRLRESKYLKNGITESILKKIDSVNVLDREIKPETLMMLREQLIPDVKSLESLLGKNLGCWETTMGN